MMYPGSVKLLQSYMSRTTYIKLKIIRIYNILRFLLGPMLVTGRGKLIEEENARRFKVRTLDANDIDTIFVDNRYRNVNGKILVICSEGKR